MIGFLLCSKITILVYIIWELQRARGKLQRIRYSIDKFTCEAALESWIDGEKHTGERWNMPRIPMKYSVLQSELISHGNTNNDVDILTNRGSSDMCVYTSYVS